MIIELELLQASYSDGSSLKVDPVSARARHLEGLLELGFCRLDPSIGMGQASGPRVGLELSSELNRGTFKMLLLELLLKMCLFCAVLVGLCALEPHSSDSLFSQHCAK